MSARISLSLVALLVGTALLVESGLATAASDAKRGGVLRFGWGTDVDSVDPALGYYPGSWTIAYATCAKLFNYPDKPGVEGARLVPEVVSRFTVSRDGRTYTFDLKPTFRFHTGAPVTARSFADAINRDASPAMQSPAAPYLDDVVGARAVADGKANTISGVRVLGRYRLQIALTRVAGDFTARLTMPFFCPVTPGTPIEPSGIDDPAGSGPYYVAERVPNRRLTLRRNRYYRGGRPANVDQVSVTVGETETACLAAVEEDRIDHCETDLMPVAAWRSLAERYGINRPGGRFFVAPGLSTWWLAFNHDRDAFRGAGQIPLKKAINFAIDRPALARAFGYLAGRRTDHLLPPALGQADNLYPIRGADPKTAKRWLAKAKTVPREIVLYTFNSSRGVELGQVFAYDLKQLGINVEVKYFSVRSLFDKLVTRGEPFDVAVTGWAADYPDPAAFFRPLLSEGPNNVNHSHFSDAGVNRRIAAADRLSDAGRVRVWADIDHDLMRDNPPWAPFVNQMVRVFVSRSVGCFFVHPVYAVFDIPAVCKK